MNEIGVLTKIKNKANSTYRRFILRDRFLIEAARWFKDNGDKTLRLEYPLTSDSLVFDVGGYHGDFAAAINRKYDCTVFIFEPVEQFFQLCCRRFQGNKKIVCFNYGLSDVDGQFDIVLAENSSSLASPLVRGKKAKIKIRSVVSCIHELEIKCIDLMKINIEGGEFELIPALIDSGEIQKISDLQVQFHNFISQASRRRMEIRNMLAATHRETWNYEFVWENWKLTEIKR